MLAFSVAETEVGKSSLPMSACVSWHRIQVLSPDEADKDSQRSQASSQLPRGKIMRRVNSRKKLEIVKCNILIPKTLKALLMG